MSFFNTSKQHTTHPDIKYVKVTLENLVAILHQNIYENGIDPGTMCETIDDIFTYLSGDKYIRIRCPAPVDNPDDRFRVLWPEGSIVLSRPPSETSHRSHRSRHSSKSYHLSSKYVSGNIGSDLAGRAMSVTSSRFSKRYVGLIDEEDEADNTVISSHQRHKQHRTSSVSKPQNTIKVNGAIMKPSPSMERMFGKIAVNDDNNDDNNNNDDNIHEASRSSSNIRRRKVESLTPKPLSIAQLQKKQNVGFSDD